MKVCIYGAGAIGGWLGVKLAQGGCALSAVARGATLDAIRAHGLRLDLGGQTLSAPAQASERAAELGVQDLVIVAVKAPAMRGVAEGMARLAQLGVEGAGDEVFTFRHWREQQREAASS